MKSIVVTTMAIIAIFIISSNTASIWLFDEEYNNQKADYGRCPIMETASVDVIFNGSDSSTVKSCATFNFESRDETPGKKSFRLRFDRSSNGELLSCASGGDTSLEHFVFPCLSTPHSSSADTRQGNLNVVIYGRVINTAGKQDMRCAMYTIMNSESYVMVVSSNTSCKGLPQMMYKQQPHIFSNWMLPINEAKTNVRRTRSTSNTKNSIKNFSGSRFYWRTG